MKIVHANVSDANIIHDIMMQAFAVYRNEVPPSSALEETIQSVTTRMENSEQALIAFQENNPVGMIRFRIQEKGIYFFRLSVIPAKQGQGIAKKLIQAVEDFAAAENKQEIGCKVRMNVPKNIQLYQSTGYTICREEVVKKPDGNAVNVVSMVKRL